MGNRRFYCWIDDKETEKDAAVVWRKDAEHAASEHAVDRWLETHDLGPHIVIARNAKGQLHRFLIKMSVQEDVTFKSGKKGLYLVTATQEVDAYGGAVPRDTVKGDEG